MKILMLDDLREPWIYKNPINGDALGVHNVQVVRNYQTAIEQLSIKKWPMLLLDHDLGEEKTGYDLVCWLEQNPDRIPRYVYLITSNPVGAKNIGVVLDQFKDKNLLIGWGRL